MTARAKQEILAARTRRGPTSITRQVLDFAGNSTFQSNKVESSAPSIGKHVLMTYLTTDEAVIGAKFLVEYLGETHLAVVAGLGASPLFDPAKVRILS